MKIDSSLSAIVTGGASGLGLATVRALRDAGVKATTVWPGAGAHPGIGIPKIGKPA